MLDRLFYPILWKIKKYIPALKEKYQPLSVIASKIKGSYGKTHDEYMNMSRNDSVFEMTIVRHINNYNQPLEDYKNELNQLKSLVNYFERKGVRIIFFEMPLYKKLANSIKAANQRNIIKNNFNNRWLELESNKEYITTDGIHLIYKSAYDFSKEFINKVND